MKTVVSIALLVVMVGLSTLGFAMPDQNLTDQNLTDQNLTDQNLTDQNLTEQYIVECSRQWAESMATGDTSNIEGFIADDFIGVNPEGNINDKAQLISYIRTEAPKLYASNQLNEVQVRFFGDNAAVAQGSDMWETQTGQHGRLVWTDTWIYRDGSWQIVAAQDVNVKISPEPIQKEPETQEPSDEETIVAYTEDGTTFMTREQMFENIREGEAKLGDYKEVKVPLDMPIEGVYNSEF